MPSLARLIARLDVKGPNVIKGIQFDGHRVVGTPEDLAEYYYNQEIDEIIFQDTVASLYQRNSLLDVIERLARRVFIPITVAGGIRSVEDIRRLLRAGADKVAINTAAVERPALLSESVREFGSQCIVASLEVHPWRHDQYEVWTDYGRQRTGIDALEWLRKVTDLGVGEVLVTSVEREGMGRGFDLPLLRRVREIARVPIIASGGAGRAEDVTRAIVEGGADAVALASILHYGVCREFDWAAKPAYVFRLGRSTDTGNSDWVRWGYAGDREPLVQPASIATIKGTLADAGLSVRRRVRNGS